MSTVSELLERFERALEASRPDYLDELAPGLSEGEVTAFEERLGIPLPEAFRQYLQWHDGQARDYYPGLWFSRSLMDADFIVEDQWAWLDLLQGGEFEKPNWWHPLWIPFATDGSSNYYVIDMAGCFGGHPGQIIEVWHDDADRFIYWPSFEKCLETLVVAHERGYRNLDYDDADSAAVEADEAIYRRTFAELNPGYPIKSTAGDACGSAIGKGAAPVPLHFKIPGRAGLIALLDPDTYQPCMRSEWTDARFVAHLRRQMNWTRLLLWSSGQHESTRVAVHYGKLSPEASDECVTGPLLSSKGRLYLTSFAELQSAAEGGDSGSAFVPRTGHLLTVRPGTYNCKIIRERRPGAELLAEGQTPADFRVELEKTVQPVTPWSEFAWTTLTRGSLQ